MDNPFLFRVFSTLSSNIYFVNTSPALIIDTGSPTLLEASIRELKNHVPLESVGYILCTHNHPDHTGAVMALKELCKAEVLMHYPIEDRKLTPEHQAKLKMHYQQIAVDRCLNDNELIELNDEQIRVCFTPGHADDHICLLLQKHRVLFSGDLLSPQDIGFLNLNYPFSRSLNDLTCSLTRCSDLNPLVICPGHGSPFKPDALFWKKVFRKITLFRENSSLLIAHTILSPLLFFIATREEIPAQECEEYIVSRASLFEGFLENVTADFVRKEYKKLIALLHLRGIICGKKNISLTKKPSSLYSEWIKECL